MAGKHNTRPQTRLSRVVPIDRGTMALTLSPTPGVVGISGSASIAAAAKIAHALRHVYSRPPVQALSLAETKACSELAYKGVAGDASADRDWVVIGDSIMKDGVLDTWISGFRAVLLRSRDHKRVVLAFAGTDPHSIADLMTDAKQALNVNPFDMPAQYIQAASLAERLQKTYGSRLRVAGHSLGGGLANYVSVRLGIPGAGINAAPLGIGTVLNLRLFNKDSRPRFTHYNNHGEVVSTYAPGWQLGERCELENRSGAVEGHFLENVDPDAPRVCYDSYARRGQGATGTW